MSDFWGIDSVVSKYVEQIRSAAQNAYSDAVDTAIAEVLPQLPGEIRNAYWGAASAWYASYAPAVYKRNYSLYNLIEVTDYNGSSASIGWEISENGMTRAQWGRGSFNPWYQIYYGGYHGGPVGRYVTTENGDSEFMTFHSPVHSTPIPTLFMQNIALVEEVYSQRIARTIESEFYKNMKQFM